MNCRSIETSIMRSRRSVMCTRSAVVNLPTSLVIGMNQSSHKAMSTASIRGKFPGLQMMKAQKMNRDLLAEEKTSISRLRTLTIGEYRNLKKKFDSDHCEKRLGEIKEFFRSRGYIMTEESGQVSVRTTMKARKCNLEIVYKTLEFGVIDSTGFVVTITPLGERLNGERAVVFECFSEPFFAIDSVYFLDEDDEMSNIGPTVPGQSMQIQHCLMETLRGYDIDELFAKEIRDHVAIKWRVAKMQGCELFSKLLQQELLSLEKEADLK